jgi:hypothetical protein
MKSTIRRILKEESINSIIKELKEELVFPLRIYRGLSKPTRSYDIEYDLVTDPYYDNTSWTTKLNVALDFGNVIYSGIVEDINDIDLMYTIERRIMHKPLDEHEIVMKNNSFIKDIRRYSEHEIVMKNNSFIKDIRRYRI